MTFAYEISPSLHPRLGLKTRGMVEERLQGIVGNWLESIVKLLLRGLRGLGVLPHGPVFGHNQY